VVIASIGPRPSAFRDGHALDAQRFFSNMLVLIYLGVAFWVGDLLCRTFFRFMSVLHRASAAVLVGLLVSSWVTFLGASAFGRSPVPLVAGNILFVLFAVGVGRFWPREPAQWQPRPPGRAHWDVVCLCVWGGFLTWLMCHTLRNEGGVLKMASLQFGDFATNLSIIQSLAIGNTFPPECPHFAGPTLSYHFMFHFLAANLEWLGLRLHTSVNLLSVITALALVLLLMTLGERLFGSRVVGRLGASLFFFHGALSYLKFFASHPSFPVAIHGIFSKRDPVFLDTIFPYRGEGWALWTLNVILAQRHLAGPMGVLVLVLVFVADAYDWRLRRAPGTGRPLAGTTTTTDASSRRPAEAK
jgi:hypothetical protein